MACEGRYGEGVHTVNQHPVHPCVAKGIQADLHSDFFLGPLITATSCIRRPRAAVHVAENWALWVLLSKAPV